MPKKKTLKELLAEKQKISKEQMAEKDKIDRAANEKMKALDSQIKDRLDSELHEFWEQTYYVREQKRRTKEVFVPLSHHPGHAQVDFGETLG
ncbi:MAG: hypothetical protein WBV62_15505, partial [Roseobacter sp.]